MRAPAAALLAAVPAAGASAGCTFARTAGAYQEPVPAANIRCDATLTLAQMQAACCADAGCASFSFGSTAGSLGGCLKGCSPQHTWVNTTLNDGYTKVAGCGAPAPAPQPPAPAPAPPLKPGWQGPFQATYTDEDCPNLGCYSKSEDWPFWIPAGTAPTVQICQQMCDYCDGTNPGHCPNGCNAFNGGDGGCCLRLCSADKLGNPSGTSPPVSYRRVDPAPAPPSPAVGRCAGQNPAWGDVSACISNNGGGNFIYHCPWESSGLVSTGKFGGCSGVVYDCVSTNVPALVKLYADHQTAANPPPEWGIPTMVYAECCVKKQCLGGPACGTPPL